MRGILFLVSCSLFLLLSACQLPYYSQAIKGQLSLMDKREPVSKVIDNPDTSPTVRQQLALSRQVLAYAANQMHLPAKDVYRQYVPLHRDAVVWNVLAAPPYSLKPYTWCYPLLGCLSYRGYFHKGAAEAEARALSRQGYDTYVDGAMAYSTLGWFDDPLTSLMIDRSPQGLVDLLLHELTHRRLYIPGDTRFDESLAVAVARAGTVRFLSQHHLPVDMHRLHEQDRARRAFLQLVGGARRQLAKLYASGRSDEAMEAGKAAIITRLRRDFQRRGKDVPGLADYAPFFKGPLNNAQLNGVQDYYGLVPAFRKMLSDCHGQWTCFWRRVDRLADNDQRRRAWEARNQ